MNGLLRRYLYLRNFYRKLFHIKVIRQKAKLADTLEGMVVRTAGGSNPELATANTKPSDLVIDGRFTAAKLMAGSSF